MPYSAIIPGRPPHTISILQYYIYTYGIRRGYRNLSRGARFSEQNFWKKDRDFLSFIARKIVSPPPLSPILIIFRRYFVLFFAFCTVFCYFSVFYSIFVNFKYGFLHIQDCDKSYHSYVRPRSLPTLSKSGQDFLDIQFLILDTSTLI